MGSQLGTVYYSNLPKTHSLMMRVCDIIKLILFSWLDKNLHLRALRPSPFAKTASISHAF